jgi:heme/copper-type cytochrome/quinol oxidase subunit 2
MLEHSSLPPRERGNQRVIISPMFAGVIIALLLTLLAVSAGVIAHLALSGQPSPTVASAAQPERPYAAHLNIVMNQPGMQKDWPAYSPTMLVVPANSLVTITLHDYDLGDTAMPKDMPFAAVQGTVGGVAYLNGRPYTSLAADKIAHTFTITDLHLNVPLPGDGKESDTISFTFRTGQPGTYSFRCYDPCGTGASGWEGPMMTKGYMQGTLTVQ